MQIPVLVEPVAGNRYRARGGEPLALSAEGATREEALQNLHDLIQSRLNGGGELVALDVKPEPPPWARFAGTWDENDPLIQEWKQAVEEYRREREADPDAL